MNYAVIKVVNGSFAVEKESGADLEKAKVQYHQSCATLHNDKETSFKALIKLVDENLDAVEGLKEFIDHTQAAE